MKDGSPAPHCDRGGTVERLPTLGSSCGSGVEGDQRCRHRWIDFCEPERKSE
jgi:hypothetical protein